MTIKEFETYIQLTLLRLDLTILDNLLTRTNFGNKYTKLSRVGTVFN